jgi:hypothetical protein
VTLSDLPSDVLAAAFIVGILVCAAIGMAWGIFFTPTAAERLEQQAERDADDVDTADILTEFRDSRPAALEMLHAPLAGACPQRPTLSHPQPARADHA